jgi:uncharacterized damage-inducible protein DinB
MADLRYPIGQFEPPSQIADSDRKGWISDIEEAPANIRVAVEGLTPDQLDTPYREGGWTLRQVVHHLADSQLQGYVRFRLALTEQEPTIKPYDEKKWAELVDAKSAPVQVSLDLLDAIHHRWVLLLKRLSASEFACTLNHPERGVSSLDLNLSLYAWHGRHHTAHVTSLRERMGW